MAMRRFWQACGTPVESCFADLLDKLTGPQSFSNPVDPLPVYVKVAVTGTRGRSNRDDSFAGAQVELRIVDKSENGAAELDVQVSVVDGDQSASFLRSNDVLQFVPDPPWSCLQAIGLHAMLFIRGVTGDTVWAVRARPQSIVYDSGSHFTTDTCRQRQQDGEQRPSRRRSDISKYLTHGASKTSSIRILYDLRFHSNFMVAGGGIPG